MSEIAKAVSSRSCYLRAFLCLIVVICLIMLTVPLAPWKYTAYLPSQLTVFESFFVRNSKNATVKELLQDISRRVKVPVLDCAAIFKGSINATVAAKHVLSNISVPLSDSFYLNLTEDCDVFQKQRGYIMSSLTDEEEQFPIAYSLMVYKDTEMVERLLRAIYRPQNLYCIHVDLKASNTTFEAISAIANCFNNVFLSSRRCDVIWGGYTVLEPELNCMEDLWKYSKWKYFINLTGQEFPLRTNHELVKILTLYRGAVDVMSSVKRVSFRRFPRRKGPPYRLRIVKGQVHIVVNREYVDFLLHNQIAKHLLGWSRITQFPDETVFAILNSNPQLGIKGTYTKWPEESASRGSFARFKNWDKSGIPCAGRRVRKICILTTGDLPLLGQSLMMFANKFFLEEDRVVIGCLEEKIFNDTRDEYMGTKVFNTTPYLNADFITNKVE
ncbi:unnamed protein product [Candidula unifasciata]|uniref:Beta-1,3-galactosyl-O-glycosyl-glycoprotein beta-1,6-N-acetylglucosaminyltransferase n=1 Tax=Candidula unifasciata TaxID=100452 RepID=A0A8S3YZ34_9EUPU|nr:unnamed protein product [Candidula unifasciata]